MRERLTGAGVLRFVHVAAVIAVAAAAEGGSLHGGAAVQRALLAQSCSLCRLKGALRTSWGERERERERETGSVWFVWR